MLREIQKTYGKWNVSAWIVHEIAEVARAEVAGLAQVAAVTADIVGVVGVITVVVYCLVLKCYSWVYCGCNRGLGRALAASSFNIRSASCFLRLRRWLLALGGHSVWFRCLQMG